LYLQFPVEFVGFTSYAYSGCTAFDIPYQAVYMALQVSEISSLFSLVSAELLVIILRSKDIIILVKTNSQRTATEQREIDRGLLRSIVLEMLLFVPASVALFVLICRPYALTLDRVRLLASVHAHAFDGLLGIVSYIFPFAAFRRVVREMALRTLRNFAQIVLEDSSKATGTGK
jgi:hypothetical protein